MTKENQRLSVYTDHFNSILGMESFDDFGVDYSKPIFEVTTSTHSLPSWSCDNASPSLHKLVEIMMREDRYDHPDYKMKLIASPFFQSGSESKDGYILIEFWKPAGAAEYLRYMEGRWLGVCQAQLIVQLLADT